ncbi:MAG: DNA polymerase III subunit beta [Oscillospiraceae bacterium]|jgi:DNA polymerase-3 subunit beta|nr:DNA polymerase III subunit beta [Oscillospiraceae bacterium]
MEFKCKKQSLEHAVLTVGKAAPIKPLSNVPEGIFLKAENDKLFLRGYNLEFGITTQIPALVKKEGEIILGAKIFSDITKKASGEQINVQVNENLLANITSCQSKFSITGMSADLYPKLPQVENPQKITIEGQELKSMIEQTLFAVAPSNTNSNPVYTGTLFDVEKNSLKLVSVDGYRMATREETIKNDKKLSFIVPGKVLAEISKLLPEKEEVLLSVGRNHALFSFLKYNLVSRLIEGSFLDYKSSVPKSHLTKVFVSTNKLIGAIERVSLVATDNSKNPIRLILQNSKLKVSCNTSCGRANDEILVKKDGDNLEIGLNSKYLIDALRNTKGDVIQMLFSGALAPIKILPQDGENFMFLVLPVMIKPEAQEN